MKKISLLAISVAVALTGCDGSDSDSSPSNPTTRTITGMDGYFNQAVVFVDKNDNGLLDINTDTVLGLTDDKGQISIPVGTTGTLAMQTIIPGGDIQKQLIAHDLKYAGKYTIDMDHPAQAMAHEVVFRAPNGSDVVTPLTDLVAIQIDAGMTEEAAKEVIREALGLEDDANLYIDFVKGENADSKLHKTAQILTESKAANTDNNYTDNVIEIAETATKYVKDTDEGKLKDPNYRPVISGGNNEGSFVPTVTTNTKLIVDKTFFDNLQKEFNDTEAEKGGYISSKFELKDESGALYSDEDQKENGVSVKLVQNPAWENFGLDVKINESTVTITSENILLGGSVDIMIAGIDKNSVYEEVGQVVTHFTLDIATPNNPPTVNTDIKDDIQDTIDTWTWQQGSEIQDRFSITNLFSDKDGDELTITAQLSNADGVNVEINDGTLEFSGTPTTKSDNAKLTLTAKDQESPASADFTLPKIEEGQAPTPPPETGNPLHNNTWYALAVESVSTDGANDYRVTCNAIKLDDNKLYFTNNDKKRATECPSESDIDASKSMSYTVTDDNTINVGGGLEWKIDLDTPGSEISAGAVTVVEKGDDSYERFTFFKNKADAEKRIKLESGDQLKHRTFAMWLPPVDNGKYNLGEVSVEIEQIEQEGNSQFYADIFFEVPNTDFTCDELFNFYDKFKFTGDNITTVTAKRSDCFDGNGDDIDYVGIDFNLNGTQLKSSDVYSILGLLKSDEAKYLEAAAFNIKWTKNSDE